MDYHLLRKFPRFFPSSCQSRHVPDIIESSIIINKTTQTPQNNTRIQKQASLSKPRKSKTIKYNGSSNGDWFSSEDDEVDAKTNTLFSLSSLSSESFRTKITENSKNVEMGRSLSELSVKSICTLYEPVSRSLRLPCGSKFTPQGISLPFSELSKKPTKPSVELLQEKERGHISGTYSYDTCMERFKVPGIPAELYYANHYRSIRRPKTTKYVRKTRKNRQRIRRRGGLDGEDGWCSIVVNGKNEDSYAVEKTSSDPYNDFRISMVEMIMEKHIFRAEDLDRLLHRFLSLNSSSYHKVIVEVFLETCRTVLAN